MKRSYRRLELIQIELNFIERGPTAGEPTYHNLRPVTEPHQSPAAAGLGGPLDVRTTSRPRSTAIVLRRAKRIASVSMLPLALK
jgi:hypothetical protein